MNAYEVHPGTNVIRTMGKFEGEPIYVPTFWERTMEGGEDDSFMDHDTYVSVFLLTTEDFELVKPDADDGDVALILFEDEAGFVHSKFCTQKELDRQMQDR